MAKNKKSTPHDGCGPFAGTIPGLHAKPSLVFPLGPSQQSGYSISTSTQSLISEQYRPIPAVVPGPRNASGTPRSVSKMDAVVPGLVQAHWPAKSQRATASTPWKTTRVPSSPAAPHTSP